MISRPEVGSRADFFVHPDFHRLHGGSITDEVEAYEAALHERLEQSPLPILIHDAGPAARTGDFWERFPAEQRFQSVPGGGNLSPDHDTQIGFNRLLEEREVIAGIVHGSYFGRCVSTFKARLHASGKTGILYYAHSPFNIGFIGDIANPDTVHCGVVLRDTSGKEPLVSQLQANEHHPSFRVYTANSQVFSKSKVS